MMLVMESHVQRSLDLRRSQGWATKTYDTISFLQQLDLDILYLILMTRHVNDMFVWDFGILGSFLLPNGMDRHWIGKGWRPDHDLSWAGL